MWQTIKMAWRNIGRHRGRTYLSLLAIIAAVWVILLTKGLADGTIDSILDNSVNLSSGHVRLIQPEYQLKERLLSLAYSIGEGEQPYGEMITEIRNLNGVQEAMGRIKFGMLLVAGEKQYQVLGNAVDFPAELRATRLDRFLDKSGAGRFPQEGKKEIVIGQKLLNKLGLNLGDKVNAVFTTSFGSFKIATFKIVGLFSSNLKFLDESVAYLPLDVLMPLLELDDAVTEIVVFGSSIDKAAELEKTLNNYLKTENLSLKVTPWDQFSEMITMIVKARAIYTLIYIFIAILAAFVVFNTLMMVVAERTREIGMLAALGFTPRGIKLLFLTEGMLVAAIGSLIGALLGGFSNLLLSRVGLDFSEAMQGMDAEIMMSPKIFFSFSVTDILIGFIIGFVVTLVAAYIPSRKASKLLPTEALRTM